MQKSNIYKFMTNQIYCYFILYDYKLHFVQGQILYHQDDLNTQILQILFIAKKTAIVLFFGKKIFE